MGLMGLVTCGFKKEKELVPEAIRKFEEKKKRMALEAKNPKKGSSDTKKNNK